MRIISEHRDYYDCVQSQGQDLNCVWVRHLEEFEFNKEDPWPFPKLSRAGYYYWSRVDHIEVDYHIIGFCGKIYPVLEVHKSGKREICYSAKEVDQFVEDNFKKKQIKSYHSKDKWKNRKNSIGYYSEFFIDFFADCKSQEDKFTNLFLDSGSPVFIAHPFTRGENGKIVYHGRKTESENGTKVSKLDASMLKDFKFFRVFETQTAFQNIHMYISGVLGFNNPHVPEMTNEVKIDSHGFDKYSFRKDKQK